METPFCPGGRKTVTGRGMAAWPSCKTLTLLDTTLGPAAHVTQWTALWAFAGRQTQARTSHGVPLLSIDQTRREASHVLPIATCLHRGVLQSLRDAVV
ncbi:hypothetical protein E2C01_030271 [Portunus trituberculatus]|uniref:Uncharacterized protein n=1 Tax=Portunus trituberculatus TaxID=210409 RepID=A0A5B7EV90_PORTR|nr:hypothetical protein [Portunus trituberculatus]